MSQFHIFPFLQLNFSRKHGVSAKWHVQSGCKVWDTSVGGKAKDDLQCERMIEKCCVKGHQGCLYRNWVWWNLFTELIKIITSLTNERRSCTCLSQSNQTHRPPQYLSLILVSISRLSCPHCGSSVMGSWQRICNIWSLTGEYIYVFATLNHLFINMLLCISCFFKTNQLQFQVTTSAYFCVTCLCDECVVCL